MQILRHWSVRRAALFEKAFTLLNRAVPFLRKMARKIGVERLGKALAFAERHTKGPLFDCQMCGNCLLMETGMSCPMNCPKQLRNGPCGGVTPQGGCEVSPDMPCVWVEAWQGGRSMKAGSLPLMINPPADAARRGKSSWLSVVDESHEPSEDPHFERQRPDPISPLEGKIMRGDFVVTAEFAPPDSADPNDVLRHIEYYQGHVDAVNVTDGAGGNCHVSSIAVSLLLQKQGLDPIMQMTCRDRNRIAMQGDILGASMLGIRNLLCLSGDDVSNGDHPEAKLVFDLGSTELLRTARHMREHSAFLSKRPINAPPQLFLGAVASPFSPPFDMRPWRLAKKVMAGAEFIQTQYCFDVPLFKTFMAEVRKAGLHKRCAILVGVGPLPSAASAKWMRKNIPGIHIPDWIITRLEAADDPAFEGYKICAEIIAQLKEIEGVKGIHIMAYAQEHRVGDLAKEARKTNKRP